MRGVDDHLISTPVSFDVCVRAPHLGQHSGHRSVCRYSVSWSGDRIVDMCIYACEDEGDIDICGPRRATQLRGLVAPLAGVLQNHFHTR